MLIKELSSLDPVTTLEIRNLEQVCRSYDGLRGKIFLDTAMNYDPAVKSVFLGYEQNELVGFVFLFIPSGRQAELSGMTHPAQRRKGCFKALTARAVRELRARGIYDLLFVCESGSTAGTAAILRTGALFEFSEYLLRYTHSKDLYILGSRFHARLFRARPDQIKTLALMDMKIFGGEYESSLRIVANTVQSDSKRQFILYEGTKPAGMAAVGLNRSEATIYGLGILPELRGRGLGRALLVKVLRNLLTSRIQQILIEVDSQNTVARGLYHELGFAQVCCVSYYRKSLLE